MPDGCLDTLRVLYLNGRKKLQLQLANPYYLLSQVVVCSWGRQERLSESHLSGRTSKTGACKNSHLARPYMAWPRMLFKHWPGVRIQLESAGFYLDLNESWSDLFELLQLCSPSFTFLQLCFFPKILPLHLCLACSLLVLIVLCMFNGKEHSPIFPVLRT